MNDHKEKKSTKNVLAGGAEGLTVEQRVEH